MDLREQSIVGCFSDFCFSVFRGAGACGVAKAIYKQFYFSHLGRAAGFNNNNNNNNESDTLDHLSLTYITGIFFCCWCSIWNIWTRSIRLVLLNVVISLRPRGVIVMQCWRPPGNWLSLPCLSSAWGLMRHAVLTASRQLAVVAFSVWCQAV